MSIVHEYLRQMKRFEENEFSIWKFRMEILRRICQLCKISSISNGSVDDNVRVSVASSLTSSIPTIEMNIKGPLTSASDQHNTSMRSYRAVPLCTTHHKLTLMHLLLDLCFEISFFFCRLWLLLAMNESVFYSKEFRHFCTLTLTLTHTHRTMRIDVGSRVFAKRKETDEQQQPVYGWRLAEAKQRICVDLMCLEQQ